MPWPLPSATFRGSMVELIKGFVVEKRDDGALFDVHGVGIYIFLTPYTMNEIKEGSDERVFVHLVFKQDGFEVYGFGSREEKKAFLSLLSVQKIGAKTAMTILSKLGYEGFIKALEEGDVSKFSGIKGVGEKTAKRIVLELKGKLAVEKKLPQDAVMALMKLGYTRQEAESAVAGVIDSRGEMSSEDIIKEVLKSG